MPLFSSPHPAAPSQRNPLRTKTNEPSSSTSGHRPGRSDGKGTFAIDMLRQMRGEGWDEEDELRENRQAQKRSRKPPRKASTRAKEAGKLTEVVEADENAYTGQQDVSLLDRIKAEGLSPPRPGPRSEMNELDDSDQAGGEEAEGAPLGGNDQFGFGLSVQRLKAQPSIPASRRRLRPPTPPPREKTPSLPSLPSTPTSNKPDDPPSQDPLSDDDNMRAILGKKRRRKADMSSSPPKGRGETRSTRATRLERTTTARTKTAKPTKKAVDSKTDAQVPPARKGKTRAALDLDEDEQETATRETSRAASSSPPPEAAPAVPLAPKKPPPPVEPEPKKRKKSLPESPTTPPRRQSRRLSGRHIETAASSSPPIQRKPRPRPKPKVAEPSATARLSGEGAMPAVKSVHAASSRKIKAFPKPARIPAPPVAAASPVPVMDPLSEQDDPDLPPSSPLAFNTSYAIATDTSPGAATPSAAANAEPAPPPAPGEEEVVQPLDSDDLYS